MLTPEQKFAFYHMCKSQWTCIYAPRRSGKTYLMTEYIQHRLENDLTLKDIMVVTKFSISKHSWRTKFPGICTGVVSTEETKMSQVFLGKKPKLIIGDEVFIPKKLEIDAKTICCGSRYEFLNINKFLNFCKIKISLDLDWTLINEKGLVYIGNNTEDGWELKMNTGDIESNWNPSFPTNYSMSFSVNDINPIESKAHSNSPFRFIDLE